jgi:NAD(P)-dependent dehydrogenase (short-subunit alcohol dehydrogenase family)
MTPRPQADRPLTRGTGKLRGKVALFPVAVAPGPIWTPLISASFSPRKVATFGSEGALGRAGEPAEVTPC